jgi:hypothetical protein
MEFQFPIEPDHNPSHQGNLPGGDEFELPPDLSDTSFNPSIFKSSSEPAQPAPHENLPAGLSFSGKMCRDSIVDVIRLADGESVVGMSKDSTRLATFSNVHPNDRGGIDGVLRIYSLANRDDQGKPLLVGSQGLRCRFNVPPIVIPNDGDNKALIIEDGNPLARLDIGERKRYATAVSMIELRNDTSPSRNALLFEQQTDLYCTAAVTSPDGMSLYLKGKRLSTFIEGWRGIDGVEMVSRHSLIIPRMSPERLFSRSFKTLERDPRHHTALAITPAGDRLLSANIGQVNVHLLDRSLKISPLNVKLPEAACVSLLEFDRAGTKLVIGYQFKDRYSEGTHLQLYNLSKPGNLDSPILSTEIFIHEQVRRLSFSADGKHLAVSGDGTKLYEVGAATGLKLVGSGDISGSSFASGSTLVSYQGGFVVTTDIAKQPRKP